MKKLPAILLLIFWNTMLAAGKSKPPETCNVYLVVMEQDARTVNLQMVGLNDEQTSWYRKHGDKFSGVCLVNGDATGKRVTLDNASESYVDNIVGSAPLYAVVWEEHRVFVPDENGGHYAWSANGVLSQWDGTANSGKGDFRPIGPIHNTNRTIFSSSSTSLLKDAMKEIQERETQRLAAIRAPQ